MAKKSLIILVLLCVVAVIGGFVLLSSSTSTPPSDGEVNYSYKSVYEYTSNGVLHTPADGKQYVEVKCTLVNKSSDEPIAVSNTNLVFKADNKEYAYVYSGDTIPPVNNGGIISFVVIYEISADANSGILEWKGNGKMEMNKIDSERLNSKTVLRYNYTYSFTDFIPAYITGLTPNPGYTYLVLHIAVKNTTLKDIRADSGPLDVIVGVNEYDSKSTESSYYNKYYTFGGDVSKSISNCKIPAGGIFKYYIVYEVPTGTSSFSTETDEWCIFDHYVKDSSITV